jgi:hypothetical protein
MAPKSPQEEAQLIKQFREECTHDGILAEGDEMNEDWVLMYVTPIMLRVYNLRHVISRFLRARQHNIPKAKIMLKNCIQWRQTVGGNGIDDLYRKIDPFDVCMHVIVSVSNTNSVAVSGTQRSVQALALVVP